MEVLYEDNHLLVLNKKSGWIVQGASPEQPSLLEWGKDYLKSKYNKPGNVFLGPVSRLDAPVTGVVPFARTSKAASRLSEQLREKRVHKLYWAIVEFPPKVKDAELKHWLTRNDQQALTQAHVSSVPESQLAIMKYSVIAETSLGCLLEIELITGRKHQIRAQLQSIGCPVLGDRKYSGQNKFPHLRSGEKLAPVAPAGGIGLHCRQLTFEHPTRSKTIKVTADVPAYWPEIPSMP